MTEIHSPRRGPKWKGSQFVVRESMTRKQKKRELRRLILAHSAIHDAYSTCKHFLQVIEPVAAGDPKPEAGMQQPLYFPLLEAIVISYARPFTDNKGVGRLKKDWEQFSHPKLQDAHDQLITARNEMVAHSDAVMCEVKIEPPTDSKFAGAAVGVGYSIRRSWFTVKQVRTFLRLTSDLAPRLHHAVEVLIEELYGDMELPSKSFPLKDDSGL